MLLLSSNRTTDKMNLPLKQKHRVLCSLQKEKKKQNKASGNKMCTDIYKMQASR